MLVIRSNLAFVYKCDWKYLTVVASPITPPLFKYNDDRYVAIIRLLA